MKTELTKEQLKVKEYNRQYYLKKKEYHRQYYLKNKEKLKKYSSDYKKKGKGEYQFTRTQGPITLSFS